jgi:uncharacterized secreted protein with C-terminal beta-propeller domain
MDNVVNSVYTTKDLGEISVLLTKGFILKNIDWKENIAYFSFTPREEAEKIAHQYNFGGVEVSARAFYDNLILVKRKILASHSSRTRYH